MTATIVCLVALLGVEFGACAVLAHKLGIAHRTIRSGINDLHQAIDELDTRMRRNHLETMKALKGDSYTGQFGGIDVHGDAGIPAGYALIGPFGAAQLPTKQGLT